MKFGEEITIRKTIDGYEVRGIGTNVLCETIGQAIGTLVEKSLGEE